MIRARRDLLIDPPWVLIIERALPSANMFYAGVPHWDRTKVKNLWKSLVLAELSRSYPNFSGLPPTWFPVHLVVAVFKRKKQLDSSNICVKLLEDALKPVVLPDDSPKYVDAVIMRSLKSSDADFTMLEVWPHYIQPAMISAEVVETEGGTHVAPEAN